MACAEREIKESRAFPWNDINKMKRSQCIFKILKGTVNITENDSDGSETEDEYYECKNREGVQPLISISSTRANEAKLIRSKIIT